MWSLAFNIFSLLNNVKNNYIVYLINVFNKNILSHISLQAKNKQKKTAVYFETIFSMVELKTVGKFV